MTNTETTTPAPHAELSSLLRDPRYWRDRDQEVMACVSEAWKRLHGGTVPAQGDSLTETSDPNGPPSIPETLEMVQVLCTSPKVRALHIATTADVLAGLPALRSALSADRASAPPAPAVPDGLIKALEFAAREFEEIAQFFDGEKMVGPRNFAMAAERRVRDALSAAPTTPQAAPVGVLAEVAAERRRQVEVEGWTPEHDDEHDGAQMATAAMCYVQSAACALGKPKGPLKGVPGFWPWDDAWWKPKGPRRDLIRAAALIVAEIERMDRAARATSTGEG